MTLRTCRKNLGYDKEINITDLMSAGKNVFAIEAWNVIGCGRSIIFDADIDDIQLQFNMPMLLIRLLLTDE